MLQWIKGVTIVVWPQGLFCPRSLALKRKSSPSQHQNTKRTKAQTKHNMKFKRHPTHPQRGLLGTHHPRCRPWGRPGALLRGTWRRKAAPGCGLGSRSSSAPRWQELLAECWRGEGLKGMLLATGNISGEIRADQWRCGGWDGECEKH